MKTIPILTMPYWWVIDDTNYGSLFQCYALQQVILRLGGKPEWIQHCIAEEGRGFLQDKVQMIYRCLRWPGRLLGRRKRKLRISNWRKDHPRHFEEFIKEHIAVTESCCYSEPELRKQYGGGLSAL